MSKTASFRTYKLGHPRRLSTDRKEPPAITTAITNRSRFGDSVSPSVPTTCMYRVRAPIADQPAKGHTAVNDDQLITITEAAELLWPDPEN